MQDNETYETKRQYAKRHGISMRTLEMWMNTGRIPYRRITARCIRIPVNKAEEALKRFDIEVEGRSA